MRTINLPRSRSSAFKRTARYAVMPTTNATTSHLSHLSAQWRSRAPRFEVDANGEVASEFNRASLSFGALLARSWVGRARMVGSRPSGCARSPHGQTATSFSWTLLVTQCYLVLPALSVPRARARLRARLVQIRRARGGELVLGMA